MNTITDIGGRTWRPQINNKTLAAIRDELQFNLDILDARCAPKLARDPALLVNVVYLTCRDQADAAGVTDEQFGRALAGLSIMDIGGPLVAAAIENLPRRARKLLRNLAVRTFGATKESIDAIGSAIGSVKGRRAVASIIKNFPLNYKV